MKRKSILIAVLIFAVVAISVMPVLAGGWATITLDRLPENVNTGQDYEIGFVVRQHGHTPMTGLIPQVVATHAETSQSFAVEAIQGGAEGHYVASLNFPQSGTWNWEIHAFSMEQPMPPLVIQSAPAEPMLRSSNFPSVVMVAGLGLAVAIAASLLFWRKSFKWALALLIVALAFTGGGFALAQNQPPKLATVSPATLSPIERGEALFLAKGCITCHTHTKVASQYYVRSGFTGPGGSAPDLSHYSGTPEFLRLWMADPTKIKPKTMPNLGLSTSEIEALIAFLSVEPEKALSSGPKEICPVTRPPDPPFVPPSPYPAGVPHDGYFWYGTDDLWTMLSTDGTWWGLPYHEHDDGAGHYSQKIFWWSKDYDIPTEPQPEFTVTARRLDAPALFYESTEATNAYTPKSGQAILTGVEVPTLGCWEFTGEYRGNDLSFVVEVVE